MPGTQPRGTYAFDPNQSSHSATQALSVINAEEDGVEDQLGPPVDSFAVHDPAAPAMPSSFVPTFSTGGTSSVVSHPFPNTFGGSLPPPSSELAPTIHHYPAHPASQQQADVFMGPARSAISLTTTSDVGSSLRKRKADALMGGIKPPSSKRMAKSKTADLDPVIISNNLNSTLNRMADIMEKSLDANPATDPATTSSVAPVLQTVQSSSISLGSDLSSSDKVIQQAISFTTTDGFLTEDELFAASVFFTSSSEHVVRAARTFITLGNNRTVQRRFLLNQLRTAALLPEKDMDNNDSMIS